MARRELTNSRLPAARKATIASNHADQATPVTLAKPSTHGDTNVTTAMIVGTSSTPRASRIAAAKIPSSPTRKRLVNAIQEVSWQA